MCLPAAAGTVSTSTSSCRECGSHLLLVRRIVPYSVLLGESQEEEQL